MHTGPKDDDGAALRPLLRASEMRALLGGISRRKLAQLRAAGVVPDPIELGPRMYAWTHCDYGLIVERLARATKAPEPECLAASRQARTVKLEVGSRSAT